MLKPIAYSKPLIERRRAGERVGLVVVSVHDWESGKWFEQRPEVCRLVLPVDVPVAQADWSCCLALDCIVTGAAVDGTFYEVCAALQLAGAASVWGDFADGIWLLEPLREKKKWLAIEGPYSIKGLSGVLRLHREAMLMLRRGVYSAKVFDAARSAMLASFRKEAA